MNTRVNSLVNLLRGEATVDADFGENIILQNFAFSLLFVFFTGEYPWQAAVLKKDEYDNVYVCGAALIGLCSSHMTSFHP